MKVRSLISFFSVFVFCASCCNGQTNRFTNYLKGFKSLNTDEVIDFESSINLNVKMTQKEALEFVYYGDTTLLSCNQKTINMENESDFRITRRVYLPEKCFSLSLPTSLLIAYTSFDCQDLNKRLFRSMTLLLLDDSQQKTDSLVVHKSDDYDFEFTGMLNPKTYKIFLIGRMKENDSKHAELILIKEGKFVIEKRSERLAVSFDSIGKYLTHLNWSLD